MTGCSVNGSIVADSLTTAYSIGGGKGKEANPILPKSAVGAAVASAVLKTVVLRSAKRRSKSSCMAIAKGVYSTSYGAAINNGLIGAGKSKHAPMVGIASGVGTYLFFSDKAASKYCR